MWNLILAERLLLQLRKIHDWFEYKSLPVLYILKEKFKLPSL